VKLEIRNHKLEGGATHIEKVLVISLRILAVCLLFAVCMGVGTALSGLDRVAQLSQPARSRPRVNSWFPFSSFPSAWEWLCLI